MVNNNNNITIYDTAYFDHSMIKQPGELCHEEVPDFMIYTILSITYLEVSRERFYELQSIHLELFGY